MSDDGIEEFEDSEDFDGPCTACQDQALGEEVVDEEDFKFLDGLDELAFLQSELFEVRGRLAESRSNGQYVPLKLYRSHCHDSLSVSDIQSSTWCERQLEYRYLYPHMKATKQWIKEAKKGKEIKKKTPVMIKGSTIHLKKELEVHDQVNIPTKTREDKWAVRLLNTYRQLSIIKEGKMEREVSVFGDCGAGILLNGIIDQLQFSLDTQELILTDLKTRRTNSMPMEAQLRGHKLQLMVYKMLLDGLTRGTTKTDMLVTYLRLNFAAQLSMSITDYICELGLQSVFCTSDDEDSLRISFGDLVQTWTKLIRGLDFPPVERLTVHYIYQETDEVIGEEKVEFDAGWAKELLESAIGFWRGKREPSGPDIEDLWKCNSCQYKSVCVWRRQKTLEGSPGVKILDSPLKSPAVRTCEHESTEKPRVSSSSEIA